MTDKSRKSAAGKGLQEISSKLGKEELVKRLRVSENIALSNSIGMLSTSLQALSQELSNLEQDKDVSYLSPHAAAIVQPAIMNHRDKVQCRMKIASSHRKGCESLGRMLSG
jgi:hypothetical protein